MAPTTFSSQLADYWKDDFRPLQAAGQAIVAALREDENAPEADLFHRMTMSEAGSHLYFPSALTTGPSPPVLELRHQRSVPLPPLVSQNLKTAKSHTLMGLLTPASLAWMSVDQTVYLWSYEQTQNALCSFTVPSGQCIVSVGLVPPKKGVFVSTVEWCLVVTTPDEVLLCALVRPPVAQTPGGVQETPLRLVPTTFSLATDSVRMLSVVGTPRGRIFLGGDDGCLYEMTYDGLTGEEEYLETPAVDKVLDQFYDEGKRVPEQITTDSDNHVAASLTLKRAWASVTTGPGSVMGSMSSSPDESFRPRKCRKLNRTSNLSPAVTAIVPSFVLSTTSFLFGGKTSTGGGKIIQMIVDSDRKCLYTLSSKGWICAFDLEAPGSAKVHLASVTNTPKTAQLYLEAVSRGQMLAPSFVTGNVGSMTFPGGGGVAQAGVGGMDGARSILKAKANQGGRILQPTSIHIVPPTESSRLTLVAVTAGGLRLYLSSLSSKQLGTSGSSRSTNGRNPLAPASRLTLCHVRSPPPTHGKTTLDAMVPGGVAPRINPSEVASVDASLYHDGVFVAAVEGSKKAPGDPVGDVVLAACPDSVARKPESTSSTSTSATTTALVVAKESKPTLTVPGGISETMSLPMSVARGPAGDAGTLLPGGVVVDIAAIRRKESTVLEMTTKSLTPIDSELGLGLPPAFFPPSDQTKPVATTSNGIQNGNGPLVDRNTALSSSALGVLGNVLTNLVLSRPISHGIAFQKSALEGNYGLQRNYRISRRTGSQGFSVADASRSKTKSFRVRPTLLRPPTVPLSQFAVQHLLGPKEFVALNAGGLHYFGFETLLLSLAESLMAAGDNVGKDSTVTSYFQSYGYKEGCAMCLALAVGCGPSAGRASSSTQLAKLASTAALTRAYVPKLVPTANEIGSSTAMASGLGSSADPLVPHGYEFRPSALSEGLTAVFSRLVRPVWNKPVVVVTEGRLVKQKWSTGSRLTPARVEILMDDDTLEDIRSPLRNLLSLVKQVFSRAIKSVPGLSLHSDSMDVDDDGNQTQFLTMSLQYHSQRRENANGISTQLSASEAESIAHLLEEKNIHSQYRLLSRVVQLLNMISLLRRAQGMVELREVDWGLLHGLTVAQLALTSDGQDRIESLLNTLVTASAADSATASIQSAQADRIANEFADQCYLFFSPGSRYAYIGLRKASQALTFPASSSRRSTTVAEAAKHLLQAAQHWHSATLIAGARPGVKGNGSVSEIAQRAIQFGSPLARAVELLLQLGDVANVVEVCLVTAANFKAATSKSPSTDILNLASVYELGWEQHLYHKKRDLNQIGGSNPSAGVSTMQTSAAQGLPPVTEAAPQDAVKTCHALILFHLSSLLESRSPLGDSMVSVCAAATDKSFLEAFFSHLLSNNHADTLLRINSLTVEQWLQNRKDPNLLCRYYNVQGRHADAGQVSWDRAVDASQKLPLDERIECLSRALNSFKAALEEGQNGRPESLSKDELVQKAKEVHDSMHVAGLQNRILRMADSSASLRSELSADNYEKLKLSLIPVSELYNDFAAAMSLFEHCLLILHACRHDDARAIESLWKNLLCDEILPCATRRQDVYQFLRRYAEETGLGDDVRFLQDSTPADSLALFETGDWVQTFENKIVTLGKELYGSGADYVFPVDFLLAHLEGFRHFVASMVSPGWSLVTLAAVGVPHLVILDAYEGIAMRDDRMLVATVVAHETNRRLDNMAAIIDLLSAWVAAAKSHHHAIVSTSGSRKNAAHQELARAMASGRLLSKMDHYKAKLEAAPDGAELLQHITEIEGVIHDTV